MKEFEEEEDGFTVDFDVLGFMRDQDKYQRIRSTGVLNFTDEDVSIAVVCSSLGTLHGAKRKGKIILINYFNNRPLYHKYSISLGVVCCRVQSEIFCPTECSK